MRSFILLLVCAVIAGIAKPANSETFHNAELPVKRIALFSSGVGYFEHEGEISGNVRLVLPFQRSAMDDALKSLTVYDSATLMPFISYPSEQTLLKTLESLRIDPSKSYTIEDILNSVKGAEIEVYAPEKITGRIVVAQQSSAPGGNTGSTLSLFTDNTIKVIALNSIISYRFTDPEIMGDLSRALELLLNAHGSDAKKIYVNLPSNEKRNVIIGYVVGAPVWKATYRLDISGSRPFLQGWAIIDNAGDTDWNNVELSLVVGRQTSFVQNLYAPYYLRRPNIPLSIASVAEARVYDDAIAYGDSASDLKEEMMMSKSDYLQRSQESDALSYRANKRLDSAGSNYETAVSSDAGEQFVFTLKKPLTLERRQSAMVPLAQGRANVKKVSIFRAHGVPRGLAVNPALGLELVNNTGAKLPPGPISVYDEGTYAGDALIEFLDIDEKRLISYGDDLSVRGMVTASESLSIDNVKINKGLMQITRKTVIGTDYNFKNSSNEAKNIILEHSFISNAKLVEPAKYSEKTGRTYRFDVALAANKDLKYTIKEERLHSESVAILNASFNDLIAYSQNKEIPEGVKDALKKAASLRENINKINSDISAARSSMQNRYEEQARIRHNIETVGKDSPQGQEYLKRLFTLDNDIDALNNKIASLENSLKEARKSYNDYVSNLTI